MSCILDVVNTARVIFNALGYFDLGRRLIVYPDRNVAHIPISVCGRELVLTLRFYCTRDYAVVLRENNNELVRWDNAHGYDHVHDYVKHCGQRLPWNSQPSDNLRRFFVSIAEYIRSICN